MDNSKVNGLSMPPQAHATAAQPPRANQVATDRFSRAMGDSPRSYAVTTADVPDAGGRGAVRGTPIQNLTREAPQENREHAYRRLQGPLGSGVMGAVARDVAADLVKEPTRAPVDPSQLASTGSAWSQLAVATQIRDMTVPRGASAGELTQMLERMCSALYVGEKSVGTQRLVMALDHVLPGAAAEIVREGAHLSIRLHARTEESYRLMSAQRDQLIRALNDDGNRRVDVSVVHGDEKSFGDGHG
jgi:hypothetical protein